ncbi:hypothetical protein VUR80DRAFT_8770 [Thermomyces stellatus]
MAPSFARRVASPFQLDRGGSGQLATAPNSRGRPSEWDTAGGESTARLFPSCSLGSRGLSGRALRWGPGLWALGMSGAVGGRPLGRSWSARAGFRSGSPGLTILVGYMPKWALERGPESRFDRVLSGPENGHIALGLNLAPTWCPYLNLSTS